MRRGLWVLIGPKFSKWVLMVYDLGSIFIWVLFVNELGGIWGWWFLRVLSPLQGLFNGILWLLYDSQISFDFMRTSWILLKLFLRQFFMVKICDLVRDLLSSKLIVTGDLNCLWTSWPNLEEGEKGAGPIGVQIFLWILNYLLWRCLLNHEWDWCWGLLCGVK